MIFLKGVRADRPGGPLALALGGPTLADALADLLGIEADQLHQGFIAEQQGGQGMHALDVEQRLQPIEQNILHEGDPLPMDGRAMDLLQQGPSSSCLRSRYRATWVSSRRATYQHNRPASFCVRSSRVCPMTPPPSLDCIAIEESEPQIKTVAYVGISGNSIRTT
jgi:hypothetical protein